jgi:hypothetical protein
MNIKSTVCYLLLLLIVVWSCKPAEEAKKPASYTMTQFMDIVQINGGSFSPDETKLLISSKETGIFNAFEIDIATVRKSK